MLAADVAATAGAFQLRAALEVERGRTLVLFGPSGSGKSLLLRVIAGIHPARGRISLDGVDLLDSARRVAVPPQRRRLGYLPQSYALFPHLSVAENVAFGLRGRPQAARRRRVEELLVQLQLEGMAARHPGQLSGGQQQRVALARALATEPLALLLDEPFAALDAPLRRLLRRELQTLRHRYGFAVVLVTHDLGDACALGDRIAVVAGGQVLQVGTPEDVLARPATPLVARITGMRNVFPGRVVRVLPGALEVRTARFTVRTPPFPFAAGAAVSLYVPPDAVTLLRERDGRVPEGTTLLRGRIVDDQFLGPLHTLYVRLSGDAAAGDGAAPPTVPAPYDLEIDLASHPYGALGVAARPEWTLALPFDALHVTAGAATYPADAGSDGDPGRGSPAGTNSSEAEFRQ
jgi:molybdate transport system ATP-binding protein